MHGVTMEININEYFCAQRLLGISILYSIKLRSLLRKT
jgi:hypothetical protein